MCLCQSDFLLTVETPTVCWHERTEVMTTIRPANTKLMWHQPLQWDNASVVYWFSPLFLIKSTDWKKHIAATLYIKDDQQHYFLLYLLLEKRHDKLDAAEIVELAAWFLPRPSNWSIIPEGLMMLDSHQCHQPLSVTTEPRHLSFQATT